MITDYVLGYGRLGVVRSRFSDQSNNATGWQVGLGGQTNLAQNWDLRVNMFTPLTTPFLALQTTS